MFRSAPIFPAHSAFLQMKNTLSPMILAVAIGVAGIVTATDQPINLSSQNINAMAVIQAILNP